MHLVKLTRLLRLLRLLQKMDRYSQHTGMILTLLMLCFSLVAHWLACVWFVLAERKQVGSDSDWEIGAYYSTTTWLFMSILVQIVPKYCSNLLT